jgi:hypothetical protein
MSIEHYFCPLAYDRDGLQTNELQEHRVADLVNNNRNGMLGAGNARIRRCSIGNSE